VPHLLSYFLMDIRALICSEANACRKSYGGSRSIPAASWARCQTRRHQFL